MPESNTASVTLMPEKEWAKRFNESTLFDQLTTLHNLYSTAISIEIKLQILGLLSERATQYLEDVYKEENKLKVQLGISKKVETLTCGEPNPDNKLKCGLPKSHVDNPLTSKHQNVNIHW